MPAFNRNELKGLLDLGKTCKVTKTTKEEDGLAKELALQLLDELPSDLPLRPRRLN